MNKDDGKPQCTTDNTLFALIKEKNTGIGHSNVVSGNKILSTLRDKLNYNDTTDALSQKKKGNQSKGSTRRRRQCDIPEWERDLREMVKERWEEAPKNLYEDFNL